MDEVWNSWELKPPPVCTVKMVLYYKKINNLKDALLDAVKTLRGADYLHKEAAILSRFLYRYRRIYRHDKGMQYLVKVNQCLKRYLKLNIVETIDTFNQCLPVKLQPAASHAYLPTRQMLKWILIRLLAFSQLFKRIIEMCKACGTYYYRKLLLGWSTNHSLLIFSMSARILTSSKFFVAKSIEWYDSFYKSLSYLEATSEFLPECKLPEDLKKWLGDVDIAPPKTKTSIDEVLQLIDLVREKESDSDGEVEVLTENIIKSLREVKTVEVDSDIEEIVVKEKGKRLKRPQAASQYEDMGVPVEDDEDIVELPVKKFKKNKEKKKKKKKSGINTNYM